MLASIIGIPERTLARRKAVGKLEPDESERLLRVSNLFEKSVELFEGDVTAAVNWLMGDEHLDPDWKFGPEGERFEVEITGDPNCLTTFKKLHPKTIEAGLIRNPGVVATAMHCVNALPYVCRAEPGLLTYLEMPLVAGRAAPGFHRDRRA